MNSNSFPPTSTGPTTRPGLGLEELERAPEGFLLSPVGPPAVPSSVGQQAMQSKLLPRIYERIWRPVGFTAMTGRLGSTLQRDVLEALHLQGDERVLDVACGPGNTTRALLARLGPSAEMVGFDAAATMLRQAVAETDDERASYVHGDAHTLPFPDDAFDAVSCQAALHLMQDPSHALGEMVRVLRPGGRIALLVTCERGPGPLRALLNRLPEAAGVTMFGRDELRRMVETAGLAVERQRLYGWFQLAGATKPEA